MSKAHLQNREVIRTFRKEWVDFDGDTRRALADVSTAISQFTDWLGREQLHYWKQQVRKREEAVRRAKYELNRAIRGPKTLMKKSGFDERKALNRARRALEEAEEKVRLVQRWTRLLSEKVTPLTVSCTHLSNLLDRQTPKALGRLDQMLDAVDDYLRPEGT